MAIVCPEAAPPSAMPRVAINGFGRIGRLTFRYLFDMGAESDVELVHVNELVGGSETAAYLVKYDSVHGTWPHSVRAIDSGAFEVDGRRISFSECKNFHEVDWKSLGVDIVVECTGKFLKVAELKPYIEVCGVSRVVVSAPVKEPSVLNVVVGVNEHKLTDEHVICTAASCT